MHQEKEEWTQPEDQVIQAQNVNIELDRIFGNDVVAGRHEVQEENIEAAREFLQMYGGTGGSDEADQIDIAEPNTEQAGMTVAGGQQAHDIGNTRRERTRKGGNRWRNRANKRRRRNRLMEDSQPGGISP